jgi:nucleotide-binding universal stress UspA family protein
LTINPDTKNSPFETFMDDWFDHHFSSLTKHHSEGDVHKELIKFIQKDSEKKLVIMGAFGRSGLSRLFHRSLAARVIEETNASLFITHQ